MNPMQTRAPRYPIQVAVEFRDQAPGSGTTENISSSGVLIERASRQAAVDSPVAMRFDFFPGARETLFTGTVVRLTDAGFAVQFRGLSEKARGVLATALPN